MADEVLRLFATEFPSCWCCGVGPGRRRLVKIDYPEWLEIHHIIKRGRRHDRRNLARLCKLCHDLAEGHRVRHDGELLPTLNMANVLWLKRYCDSWYYERSFLKMIYGKALPRAVPARLLLRLLGLWPRVNV